MAETPPPPDMPAAQDVPPWAAGTDSRLQEVHPTLSDAEIETVSSYGTHRRFEDGERLWEIGQRDAPFYLVLAGEMDVLRRDEKGEHVMATHGRGRYAGEIVTMTGRAPLVAGRAKGTLEAIEVTPQKLRDLLALEAELGEKILLSFILRRMRMIAGHLGDVILVGEREQKETAALQEFLSRNGVPFNLLSPTNEADKPRRDALGLAPEADWPMLICGDRRLLRPGNKDVADCLGLTAQLPQDSVFDTAVIGAGPAGLAAAVYAASEGLKVVVLEQCAVGGQAGSSSRIENYLGFPTGISGQALTGRGFIQAHKFGAEIAIAREVTSIACEEKAHILTLEDGSTVRARSIVIASGAVYRQPQIEGLSKFERTGVHYGASHIEGLLCRNRPVAVVGGGNSAGQAAVYLSRRAKSVSILIRGPSLAASMSDYLVRRIDRIGNIDIHPHTEVVRINGEESVASLTVTDNQSGTERDMAANHLFVFIGAAPASGFAGSAIAQDSKGFIKTGPDLSPAELSGAGWPLERKPFLLETSCPRIFAAGDIRSGSVKRVASAVGEGSICVQFLHTALAELSNDHSERENP